MLRTLSYDAAAAGTALAAMDRYGYNTVRVFLNGACATGCLGDAATADDLADGYVANVVDFLGKARALGLQVIVVAEGLPVGTSYAADAAAGAGAQFEGVSLAAGSVTGANGQTYDVAVAAERQALMDDGLVHWPMPCGARSARSTRPRSSRSVSCGRSRRTPPARATRA